MNSCYSFSSLLSPVPWLRVAMLGPRLRVVVAFWLGPRWLGRGGRFGSSLAAWVRYSVGCGSDPMLVVRLADVRFGHRFVAWTALPASWRWCLAGRLRLVGSRAIVCAILCRRAAGQGSLEPLLAQGPCGRLQLLTLRTSLWLSGISVSVEGGVRRPAGARLSGEASPLAARWWQCAGGSVLVTVILDI